MCLHHPQTEFYLCTLMASQHDTGRNLPHGNSQRTAVREGQCKVFQGDPAHVKLSDFFKSCKDFTPCN